MIMVVFIHSDAVPELSYSLEIPKYVEVCKTIVTDGICSVAIPGFFFVSGLLLFAKEFSWKRNIKKKIKSILLPYFFVNTFWILFFNIMQSIECVAPYFASDAYQVHTFKEIVGAYVNPIPLYYPFWFLHDLFILNIFAAIIKWLIDKVPILFVLFLVLVQCNMVSIPFLVSNNSFCMFSMGYYLVKYKFNFKTIEKNNILATGLLFGVIIFAKLYIFQNSFISFFHSVVGSIFFYLLSGYVRESTMEKKVVWCAQFTFFIYAFHEYYEAMLKRIVMTVVPQYGVVQLIEYFLIPVCMVGICISVGAFMKKKLPFIYKCICGFR